jgi:hypothetical protein
MCQIYVRYENCEELPDESINNQQWNNPDGGGIAYIENDKIKIFKSFDYTSIKNMIRLLERDNIQFIVHYRMSTAGGNCKANLHPFPIGDNMVMFHNGTISEFSYDKIKSDTRLFAEYLEELGVSTIEDIKLIEEELIEIIGTSYDKLVFMDSKGEIHIINAWIGEHSKDGLCWSSSIDPFTIKKKRGKYSSALYNDYDYMAWNDIEDEDDRFDYRNTSKTRKITDNYGNFTRSELDILQYMLDYESDKIKSLVRTTKLMIGEYN